MADLGNRANVNSAIDLLLDDLQPDEAIQPSDHNVLLKDILDTLANGLSTVLRTGNTTDGQNLTITSSSIFQFANGSNGRLQSDTLTAFRNWTLPDATGTIALIGDVFTAGSGITENAGQIDLGGTLTIDAIINGAGNRTLKLGTNVLNENLSILEKNSIQAFERYANSFPFVNSGLEITKNPGNFIGNLKSSATDYVQFRLTSDEFLVNSFLGTNNLVHQSSSTLSQTIVSDTSGGTSSRLELYGSGRVNLGTNGSVGASIVLDSVNTFTDRNTTAKGLEYALDYSANYTDRSLVDKAFVLANAGDSIYTADGTIGAGRVANITDSLTLGHLKIDQSIFGNYSFIGTTTKNSSTGYNIAIYKPTGQMSFNVPSGTNMHFDVGNSIKGKLLSNGDWVFGGTGIIGTENICLKKPTAIQGIGTSGSSALAIYDNDTTPNKLWDFLDNGNVDLDQNTVLDLGANNITFKSTTFNHFNLYRSASGNGSGAAILLKLNNSLNQETTYNEILSIIETNTANSENGAFWFRNSIDGTIRTTAQISKSLGFYIDASYFSGDLFKIQNGSTSALTVDSLSKTTVNSGGYNPFKIKRNVNSVGNGSGMEFENRNSSNTDKIYASIIQVIKGATAGNEDGSLQISVMDGGSLIKKVDIKNNSINLSIATSSTGTVVGDIWSQNGTVKIGNPSANITSIASVGGLTVNADTTEMAKVLALATNITINAPTGTPNDNQSLWFRILDNGTSRTITLNAVFEDYTGNFPTSTTAGKYLIFAGKWNADEGKWNILAWKVQP
tara:strand:+ start:350 stop:2707 length:2358 start_codon:yes stop_codon:yes gene_type:complete